MNAANLLRGRMAALAQVSNMGGALRLASMRGARMLVYRCSSDMSRVLCTNRLALRLLATILQRFPKTRGNANYRRKSARCILF
jgi:hypothetical protein